MPVELPWQKELSRRTLIIKTIFDGSSWLLQNKNLSALPDLNIRTDRRQFLKILGLGGTATIVWAASGCSNPFGQTESPDSPKTFLELSVDRRKLSEISVLREDTLSVLKEREKGLYTLGQFAVLNEGAVTFQDFADGKRREYKMPVKVSGPQMTTFSPDGKQLSLWCRELNSPGREYTFILDLLNENLSKIDERVFNVPLATLSWSDNGRWLLFQSLVYGDPAKTPPGEARLIDALSRKIVYSESTSLMDSFSFSSGSRFLVHNSPGQLTVFNLEKGTVARYPSPGLRSSLSADGKSLISAKGRQVRFVNLENGQETVFDLPINFENNNLSFFGFSPNGKKLVLMDNYFPDLELSILDIEKKQKTPLPSLPSAFMSAKTFFKSEQELILAAMDEKTRGLDVRTADLDKGKIINQKLVGSPGKGDFELYQFLNSDYFLSILYSPLPNLDAQLYLGSIKTGKTFLLEGAKFKAGHTEGVSNWDIQVSPLSNGSVITSNNESYLFQKGLRYTFGNPETEKFFKLGKLLIKIPQRIFQQIPESVNKLNFYGGDLLLTKDGNEAWFLREGQRYKVEDLEKFQKNVQFNRQRYQVPQSLLEIIPEGEDSLKSNNNFKDWDGHLIEVHREGSLLILFVQGWDSSSDPSSFQEIKAELIRQGHTPGRSAEFSYKVERQANGEIKPLLYGSSETNIVPMLSKQYLEWQIERYKKLFPWANIVLVAHSLGGYLAFRAAFNHMDAVRTIITLDSPLKGIKKTILGGINESILRRYWGSQVPTSLLTEAEAVSDERIELMAQEFKRRGVELFTFASTGDFVVPHECAFLENSTQELGGISIRDKLEFYMGRLAGEKSLEGLSDNWKDLIIAHGTVIRHPDVIKLIAMILGKIN